MRFLNATNARYLDRKAKLLVECRRGRLPAEEVLQCVHLAPAAASGDHLVAVPSSLVLVHGVLLEMGVEHVVRKDAGVEVAVVTSIVAADEVVNAGIRVAPSAVEKVSRCKCCFGEGVELGVKS